MVHLLPHRMPPLLPEPGDGMIINTMLSASSGSFTAQFFKNPLSGLATLYEAADFFATLAIIDDYYSALEISEHDCEKKLIKLHIWLLQTLEVNAEYFKAVIGMFKQPRVSPNTLLSGHNNEYHRGATDALHPVLISRGRYKPNVDIDHAIALAGNPQGTPRGRNNGPEDTSLPGHRLAHRGAQNRAGTAVLGLSRPFQVSPIDVICTTYGI